VTSSALTTGVHAPVEQFWQALLQALLQHLLSTQLPLTQSVAVPHVEP